MCCFNKVNLSAILSVHKRIINKDCTVKNNNEILKHNHAHIKMLKIPIKLRHVGHRTSTAQPNHSIRYNSREHISTGDTGIT